jgi:hypothetical protein
MSTARVYLFVDNSNIFISSKAVAERREGRAARDAVRISFENLLSLAVAERPLGKAFVVGSIPPEQRVVWNRLEQQTGVKPELYERGGVSGHEQGLDQCLQVHMLRSISDNETPQTAVLMTGDGAGYDTGVGFHADMERMHDQGWAIEVVAWDISCRKALKEWASTVGVFIALETYYDSITFLEGGRHATQVPLGSRPVSSPRPGPVQLAEERAKAPLLETIRRMEKERADEQKMDEDRARAKEKYLKRMARRKRR